MQHFKDFASRIKEGGELVIIRRKQVIEQEREALKELYADKFKSRFEEIDKEDLIWLIQDSNPEDMFYYQLK